MCDLPPPPLKEVRCYESWRCSIKLWQNATTMAPRRQALVVRTELCKEARDVALQLDASDLNHDQGMDVLMCCLDGCFRNIE